MVGVFFLGEYFKTIGLILLTTATSSAMVAFIVTFFKSQNAFTSFSTVLGTLIGFDWYLYSSWLVASSVQLVVKLFPVSHAAVLFRQVFMEVPMAESFTGAPVALVEDFKLTLGVVFSYGDSIMDSWVHLVVLGVSFIFFLLLAIWRFKIKKNSI